MWLTENRWARVQLGTIASFDIPPTMEIQTGTYMENEVLVS